MAQVTITQLPAAQSLTGTESVPISQNGQTVQTTVAAIANSPTQQQTFLTVTNESTLPNSRQLQGSSGVGLVDTGSLGSLAITLNGVSGSLESSTDGLISKSSGVVVGRTITGSSTGVAVANGNGVGANPVISLDGTVGTINGLSGTGIMGLVSGSSVTALEILGTANEISVVNGTGPGNPTVAIVDNPIIPGTGSITVPVGTTAERPGGVDGMFRYNTTISAYETYSSGNWNAVASGGVTNVSVVTANGLAGLVANPSTTPAITLSTTVVGVVKGDGSSLSAATSAVDYVAPSSYASANGLTMAAGRLLGRTTASTGAAEEISVAGGLSLSGGVLTGALGSVVSVSGVGTVNGITLTGTVTSSGDLTLGGTLSNVNLASQVTGTLPVLNGGTGATIASTARSNLGAAASGANTDITSIALTTGTVSTTPSANTDIVNKLYVDSTAQGLNFHEACQYASTANFTAAYNNGVSGVGATLTNSGALAAFAIDGYTFVSPGDIGKRVLIKDQTTASENGVYTVTTVGSGAIAWVLTRATDFDTAGTGANQIDAGDFFYILNGTAYANTSWVQQTPLPITVGVTSLVFIQFGAAFSGVASFDAGTTGLTPNTATTGNVTLGGTLATTNGGTNLTSFTANGLVYASSTSALATGSAFTFDGTNVSTTGQVISTKTGSSADGSGQVYLNGATSNRVEWNTSGTGTPAFTTRSDGTKALLYPAISGSQVDYAIGISAATLWSSVPVNSSSFYFKWYGGETQVASLDGTGAFTAVGGISGGTF